MKLLFSVSRLGGGGMERVCAVLTSALAERGHDIVIATTCQENENSYEINPSVRVCSVASKYTGRGKLYGIIGVLHRFLNILRIARREKPDCVISFMPGIEDALAWSCVARKIPVVASEHTNVMRHVSKERPYKLKYVYRLMTCVTVLTRYDYNLWRNKYTNVVRMPNPISIESHEGSSPVREKTVLAAGRVDSWDVKGFDNLIRCWAKICYKYPDWKLKIAGFGSAESMAQMDEFVQETGAANVEFLGFRKDVSDLMNKSEVFCLSSRQEGLPMVLLEAMNAGCCCVSFDVVTGPREIIDDNKNGLLAKNQDIDDLANKLDVVMSDDELRHRLSANAPAALKKYSMDGVVRRWETLFSKIVK